jgi:hypothetical protein
LASILAGAILLSHSAHALAWTNGHGDIGAGLHEETPGDFELHPHWHLHDGAVVDSVPLVSDGEYDAGTVTAIVPASRAATMPNNAALITGTGAAFGSTIYTIPQSSEAGTYPWLGLGAEELAATDWAGGTINFSMGPVVSPSGSGHFSVYQSSGLGDTFFFSTADGGSNPGLDLTAGSHDHFTWAFTEAGTWSVDITVSGDYIGAVAPTGNYTTTETFSFQVVPEPSSFAALAGIVALGFAAARRRRSSRA